ncbi:MAG: hypothetical protein JXR87_04890 [Candidatus Marinimicrobia bacterium]|nr:hypothetical protein [Candidatus Neomarinimicrobiota bacterium]
MKIIVYEDEQVVDLFPITLMRPAFQIPVGGWTLKKLLEVTFPNDSIEFLIRDEMTSFFNFQSSKNSHKKTGGLLINARAVPSLANIRRIKSGNTDLDLINYPHEIIIWHKRICRENLEFMQGTKKWAEIQTNVYVGENVKIGPNVHFNSNPGIIIIDDETEIFPFTAIEGPVMIGKNCKILEHTVIKDRVIIGDVCKIRGEVTELIFMNYSNKQHYGFLGNAFVGEWVNLGAGTCNSDLKNTYGEIRVKKGNEKINTGEQFLGCVIGDYTKSAINTSIFTGKTIGVSSYLYGFVDDDVPSFVSYMKYLSCGSFTFKVEKSIDTQKRMFSRRKRQQMQADVDLLHYIFESTRTERDEFFK